jgi:hypothetical protein
MCGGKGKEIVAANTPNAKINTAKEENGPTVKLS